MSSHRLRSWGLAELEGWSAEYIWLYMVSGPCLAFSVLLHSLYKVTMTIVLL